MKHLKNTTVVTLLMLTGSIATQSLAAVEACEGAAEIDRLKPVIDRLQTRRGIRQSALLDFARSAPRFTETAFVEEGPAWSWNLSSSNEKTRGKLEVATKGDARHRFAISLEGNVSEDASKDAVLTSIDGLSNDGKVGLSYTFTRVPERVYDPGPIQFRINALKARIRYIEMRCSLADAEKDRDKACAENAECKQALSESEELPATQDGARVSRYTFSSSYARPSFSTFDTTSFESTKDTKSAYELEAKYRFYPGSYNNRVDVSLKYGRLYTQAGSKKQFCYPVGELGLTECVDAKSSIPAKVNSRSVVISYGGYEAGDKFLKGYEFILSYDDTNGAFGFQMPLYLFEHKDFGLNGGFRVNYVSKNSDDEEDFKFELFFGQSLDLFK